MSQNTQKSDNVKIPLPLFNATINILETISHIGFEEGFSSLLDSVLCEYHRKKDSLALRDTYAKIVCAKNDDERFDARINYLHERQRLKGARQS